VCGEISGADIRCFTKNTNVPTNVKLRRINHLNRSVARATV
jgi:hypothetical protein